ncbi:MAG: hypothetical protein HW400_293 [Candidatus Levybacteria bacterium]|nr:hypothetical protein [Candidatus Levybacteria bacterium]
MSVIINEVALYIDAILRNSLVAGQGGIPLRFTSSSLFGSASTNWPALLIDIIFWFLIIWGIWELLQKTSKKKK